MTIFTNEQPKWFWAVSVFTLFFSFCGVMTFVSELLMSKEVFSSLTANERYFQTHRPFWVLIVFGVNVICGGIAAILILLRNKLAFKFGTIAVLCTSIQILYFNLFTSITDIIGIINMQYPLIILITSVLLLLFVKYSIIKKWLS
ncbi:hypothetical protein LCGC14_0122120 [marine sediment metagenome]|uniref:Uncharacterized protein n=1 Tax=marine sediment metagenome TaxID=412755 RepID=A0A0F9V6F2_9ZZZZ|nr:hypothetical protein [Maribacter sp.]HDZ05944.1 hypothetical protein [Maribacter sp.]